MTKNRKNLLIDLGILFASIIFAIWLGTSHAIEAVIVATQGTKFLGALIGGLFFTSIFTTAPSIIILSEVAQNSSVFQTALIGAIGALIGDMIMYKFLRDRLAQDFYAVFGMSMKTEISHIRMLRVRWLITLIGGLIIASPFPDELGLAILGFSNTRTYWVAPVSLICNFLGILVIGVIAT